MVNTVSHKERTRRRILNEAAKALRLKGLKGASVATLMERAGLTHGGFYAHFASKDELIALAVDRMFDDTAWMITKYLSDASRTGLTELVDFYLSEEAYRQRERGCPLPALSSETHRMPPAARARFERGISEFKDAIADALARLGHSTPREFAASVVAELAGAMILARSFSEEATALEILAACRAALKARVKRSGVCDSAEDY